MFRKWNGGGENKNGEWESFKRKDGKKWIHRKRNRLVIGNQRKQMVVQNQQARRF